MASRRVMTTPVLLVFLIVFIVLLAIPLGIELTSVLAFQRLFWALQFMDTGITITTFVESVIVFFGAFFGVYLTKRFCKRAKRDDD